MVVAKYRYGEREQAFVHLKDRSAVLSFQPEQWWNQQRSGGRKGPLTAKEQDRFKVLQEVRKAKITKKQAAVELGLSVRRACQLLSRWQAGGDTAIAAWAARGNRRTAKRRER